MTWGGGSERMGISLMLLPEWRVKDGGAEKGIGKMGWRVSRRGGGERCRE